MAFAGAADDGHNSSARTHFMLVPMMAQGHTIPMTHMARLLAEHGAQVTIVTTPVNASRLTDFIAGVEAAGLAIRLMELHFPAAEFGLPDGCENLDMMQSKDLLVNFFEACAALQEPLVAKLREQHMPPSCIISDHMHWWTGDIARELGIPRLMFTGICGLSSLVKFMEYHEKILEHITDEDELVAVPGFPTPFELTKSRFPGRASTCLPGLEKINNSILEEELRYDGEIINSFQELENLYIESYEQRKGKQVWPIGPMCLSHRDSKAARGNKASVDEVQCLQWLDSMKAGSVIFVSFGSLACPTPQQLVELGLGLEASKNPFIWVIRAGYKFPEVEEWLGDGFEDRVKDRGMIIRGWAPQVMILSHQAIGGFMTHCGWNSTIEGICAGVPMITWPHFAEQFVNEKLVVDVLKTGVEVGVKGVTYWGREQNAIMVTMDAVETAVSTLMDEGVAADEMRMTAKDLAIKANRALDEGGSSYNNIRLLIQEMENKTNASA